MGCLELMVWFSSNWRCGALRVRTVTSDFFTYYMGCLPSGIVFVWRWGVRVCFWWSFTLWGCIVQSTGVLGLTYRFLMLCSLSRYCSRGGLPCLLPRNNGRKPMSSLRFYVDTYIIMTYYLNNTFVTCIFSYVIYVAWRDPSMHSTLRTHLHKAWRWPARRVKTCSLL